MRNDNGSSFLLAHLKSSNSVSLMPLAVIALSLAGWSEFCNAQDWLPMQGLQRLNTQMQSVEFS
jgi:hypothetical protein